MDALTLQRGGSGGPSSGRLRRLAASGAVVLLWFLTVSLSSIMSSSPAGAVTASSEGWTLKQPATSPPSRYGAVSAYDPATAQLIVFGGYRGTYGNDTWNWTGSTWQQLSPATSPAGRIYAAMAYDPAIGKVVMFGGTVSGVYSNETWVWDGSTWTKLAATGPTGRYGASLAFDPTTGKLILFGGVTAPAPTYSNETWTFDGTNWAQLSSGTTGTPPSGRSGAAMSFDQATGKIVLFGGTNGVSQGDTWTFANGAWTQLSPSTSPFITYSAMSFFDPDSGQLVLFETANTSTWTWNGTTWSQANGGPSPRSYFALTFDPRVGQGVLFGGYWASNTLAETWTFGPSVASTNWSQLSPATSPSWRTDSVGAYDGATGQFLMYGGYGSPGLQDTWSWSGSNWTQLSPATTPTMSFDMGMAWDAATGQLIMFGGTDSTGNTALNATYSWSGTNWVKLSPATSPPVRYSAWLSYDSATGQLIMFGGNGTSGALNDTWSWNGTTWTQLHPTNSPSVRQFTRFADDPGTGQLVLFGGGATSTTKNSETWTWDGTNWTKQTPATVPGVRWSQTMSYDPVVGRLLMFGGSNNSQVSYSDTWAWDGSNWTQLSPTTSPQGRDVTAADFDPRSGQFMMFGGYAQPSGNALNDTWVFDVTANGYPALTTAAALTYSSITLNGYDQHVVASQSISVVTPTGSNWNISVMAGPLTSGGNTLPPVTINGSGASYSSSAAPTVTCSGTGCSIPTVNATVGFPLTIPTYGNAMLYSAKANTGSGTQIIGLDLWASIPASASAGTYTSVLALSTNFGP